MYKKGKIKIFNHVPIIPFIIEYDFATAELQNSILGIASIIYYSIQPTIEFAYVHFWARLKNCTQENCIRVGDFHDSPIRNSHYNSHILVIAINGVSQLLNFIQ